MADEQIPQIADLMRRLDVVGKDGHNGHHGYNFRGIDQILNALGPAMRDLRMSLDVEVVGFQPLAPGHVLVHMRYLIKDDNGKVVAKLEALGEGKDGQDKAAYKAMAGAAKYALGHGLAIPFEADDPDAAAPVQQQQGQAQPPVPNGIHQQDILQMYGAMEPALQQQVDAAAAQAGIPNWKQQGVPSERVGAFGQYVASLMGGGS